MIRALVALLALGLATGCASFLQGVAADAAKEDNCKDPRRPGTYDAACVEKIEQWKRDNPT